MEWSDPPRATRRGKWAGIFRQLEARPGEWAKLKQGKKRNIYSLAGRLKNQAGPEFEFASRTLNEEEAGVWGRFIGLESDESLLAGLEIEEDHDSLEPEELPDPI
jgi:hypothetical protein